MDRSVSPLEVEHPIPLQSSFHSNLAKDAEDDKKSKKEDIADKFVVFEKHQDRFSKRLKVFIDGNTSSISEEDLLMNTSKMCQHLGRIEEQKLETNPQTNKRELVITFACIEESNRAKTAIQRGDIKDNGLMQYLASHRLALRAAFEPVPADESRICLAFENVLNDSEMHEQLLFMESEAVYVFFKNRMDASIVMTKMQGQTLGGRELHVKSAIPRNDSFLQTRHLWIGNIDEKDITDTKLRDRFSPYGEIETIKIFKMKAHAFVDFFTVPSAANARFFLDGAFMGNMKIIIRFGKQEFSRSLRVSTHPGFNSPEEISKLFGKYGHVTHVEMSRMGMTEIFGVVDFEGEDDAKNALNDLQGAIINGAPISIDYNMDQPMMKKRNREDNNRQYKDNQNNRDHNRGKGDDKNTPKKRKMEVIEGTQNVAITPTKEQHAPNDANRGPQPERVIPLQTHVVPVASAAHIPTVAPPVALPFYHPDVVADSKNPLNYVKLPPPPVLVSNDGISEQLRRLIGGNSQENPHSHKVYTMDEFRANTAERYKKCLLTDCPVREACAAAWIQPLWYRGTNHVSNGLYLRKDIKSLVDKHLIRLKPLPNSDKVEVELDVKLQRSAYHIYGGKMITITDPITRELLSIKMRGGPNVWTRMNQSPPLR
ncbi:hypothetical protein PROFUN_15571 [Planoprotostelium fungivorum]|uniref:RRM domain-containing protein n=1 Tax=Planoprotostelium fungivorum TaxID=1890364 RepID=A0A2P6MZ25_9EUKA|nr:hypothetical protein PROFUN_15571 [Planoprotostelium fungivorum]